MAEAPRQLNLPTASRLIGALVLAGSGVAMYFILAGIYPDGADLTFRLERNLHWFVGWFAAVGILVGWRFLGTKAAGYDGSGISLGIQAAISMGIWIVLGMAAKYSVQKMIKNAYGANYTAAVLDWLNQALFYVSFLVHPVALPAALALGAVSGMITVAAGRHWR